MPAVIKATDRSPKLASRLETINVSDHLGEARVVLEKSREKARGILREAQAEARRITDKADERGFESGFRRGYEAGAKAGYEAAFAEAKEAFATDQEQVVQAMHGVVEEFEQRKRDILISAEADIVEFATRVAEAVTKQVGAVNAEAASANLQAALQLVQSMTDLVVSVHPNDVDAIGRFVETVKDRFEQADHIRIVGDESIAPGGCRLASPEADIDATLDTQLAQMAAIMGNRRGGDA